MRRMVRLRTPFVGDAPDVLYMTVVSKNPQGILRIFWDSAKRMLPTKERFTNIQNRMFALPLKMRWKFLRGWG